MSVPKDGLKGNVVLDPSDRANLAVDRCLRASGSDAKHRPTRGNEGDYCAQHHFAQLTRIGTFLQQALCFIIRLRA